MDLLFRVKQSCMRSNGRATTAGRIRGRLLVIFMSMLSWFYSYHLCLLIWDYRDCPRLCIDYWNRQENIPIPKNVPRQHQQRPSSSSSQTIQSYIQRLQKYNIDNNSLVPYYRKQGYRLSYDLDYPTAETDWKKELRVIHFVQRVKSTDQILAYVSW